MKLEAGYICVSVFSIHSFFLGGKAGRTLHHTSSKNAKIDPNGLLVVGIIQPAEVKHLQCFPVPHLLFSWHTWKTAQRPTDTRMTASSMQELWINLLVLLSRASVRYARIPTSHPGGETYKKKKGPPRERRADKQKGKQAEGDAHGTQMSVFFVLVLVVTVVAGVIFK